jgi:hypothetical protein
MTRICDGTGGNQQCPRKNQCEGDCHFNVAEKQFVHWEGIQRQLIWASWAFVSVIVLGLMLGMAYVIGRVI